MKAILEFDLDDHSDKLAHRRCVNATNAYIALFDISNVVVKLWEEVEENSALEALIDRINDAMEDINLDDLE